MHPRKPPYGGRGARPLGRTKTATDSENIHAGRGTVQRANGATMRQCKACAAEGSVTVRPAPYPGPRCATHHRRAVKASRSAAHERRVQRVYGLSPGEYEALYEAQGGRCAICRRATGATRRLSVDHDHRDGRVRGLLCRPCNNMLGHMRDDIEAFQRAVSYLS